jgi:hypothetical protein
MVEIRASLKYHVPRLNVLWRIISGARTHESNTSLFLSSVDPPNEPGGGTMAAPDPVNVALAPEE